MWQRPCSIKKEIREFEFQGGYVKKVTSYFILLLGIFIASGLYAAPVTYQMNKVFDGITPSGTGPWGTATFTDQATNTVDLKMQLNLQNSSEFISDWAFNYNGTSALGFVWDSSSTGPVFVTPVSYNPDKVHPAGAGILRFDFNFEYDTANSSDRFAGNEWVQVTITGTGIVAADFDVFAVTNQNVNTLYHTGMHVQGIGTAKGSGSGFIVDSPVSTPEPGSLLLLGFGLIGLGAIARKRINGKGK